MKREIIVIAICVMLAGLCACGNVSESAEDATPGRMVSQIDFAAEPEDEALIRRYSDQEQLSHIMRMLREMDTGEEPEMSPYQSGEHVLYNITVTYANGNTNLYSIMDNRYFREGVEDWCEAGNERVAQLLEFIRDNPNE